MLVDETCWQDHKGPKGSSSAIVPFCRQAWRAVCRAGPPPDACPILSPPQPSQRTQSSPDCSPAPGTHQSMPHFASRRVPLPNTPLHHAPVRFPPQPTQFCHLDLIHLVINVSSLWSLAQLAEPAGVAGSSTHYLRTTALMLLGSAAVGSRVLGVLAFLGVRVLQHSGAKVVDGLGYEKTRVLGSVAAGQRCGGCWGVLVLGHDSEVLWCFLGKGLGHYGVRVLLHLRLPGCSGCQARC